jgi:N-acetylglucosaminyldiphosphoundecaprenol N-acetyl-beta-D-mannosaminyltransferase
LVIEAYFDTKLRNIVNKAGLVTSDGMPLVWWLRLKGAREIERVYGPELMVRLCALAEQKKWKVALLGGAAGQARVLKKSLKKQFSRLSIVAVFDTPNRLQSEEESIEAVRLLHTNNPQLVFVGVGCPFQEKWMGKVIDRLPSGTVLIGVGAAFDFVSGRVRQAPTFLQQVGLEWLFRLSQDPVRLWKRYLIYNPLFLFLLFKETIYSLCYKKY